MRIPVRPTAGATLSTALAAVLVAGGVVLAGAPAQAASVITVTTVSDNASADGSCSLREAVANANDDAATHPDCAAGSGADTIRFDGGGAATIAVDPTLGALKPSDPDGLVIDGVAPVTLDGGDATQLLDIQFGAELTLEDLTLTRAAGSGLGGAVLNQGRLTVRDTTFTDNASTGSSGGGAILNVGTLLVERSTFSSNHAASGGAVRSLGTSVIDNSTFYLNSATVGRGGAIVTGADGHDTWTANTFFRNSAVTEGGAVASFDLASLRGNVFQDNEGAGVTCYAVVDLGYNVSDDSSCSGAVTSLPNTSAQLDPAGPGPNGGLTLTIALGADSPAIDLIPAGAAGCTATNDVDQRGFPRPVDGDGDGTSACDAGAYEASAPDTAPPVVTVPANQTATATSAAGATVTYPAATATDAVDGPITPTCTPASGSTFPVGTTTVTCAATDAAGNTGSAAFTVTVTAAPIPDKADLKITLTGPATAARGATVTYTVTVTNTGPAAATNPTTVLGGAGLTTTATSPTTGTGTLKIGSTTLTGARWTTATLPTGGTLTYTLTGKVTAKAGQTIALAAGTLATTPDPQLVTNLTAIATRIR